MREFSSAAAVGSGLCDWLDLALSVSTEPVQEYGRGPKEMNAEGDQKTRGR
jgi:hypothetical protein